MLELPTRQRYRRVMSVVSCGEHREVMASQFYFGDAGGSAGGLGDVSVTSAYAS